MNRKRIMIGAAGTNTGWHLANTCIGGPFADLLELYTADTHPGYLVPAAGLARAHFQVLRVAEADYRSQMLELFQEHSIDIYIPLVDADTYTFPVDDPELQQLGVASTAPPGTSAKLLEDKLVMNRFLIERGIAVPETYTEVPIAALEGEKQLFSKPRSGFGSRGAQAVTATAARELLKCGEVIIQECCQGPEITVEVYNAGGQLETLCRERLEVKAGVCTKAKVWQDAVLHDLAATLVAALALPVAFCFQVMKNRNDQWVVTDLNPRMGAGTALASKAGFSLTSAALATWADLDLDPLDFLAPVAQPLYVLRVYSEMIPQNP